MIYCEFLTLSQMQAFNRSMEQLGANGYMRARMVRVRLLHAFISRLIGARACAVPLLQPPAIPLNALCGWPPWAHAAWWGDVNLQCPSPLHSPEP